MTTVAYDCSRCPGYCCSYPRIAISESDIERLAGHLGLSHDETRRRFTKRWSKDETVLRHRKDDVYASTCILFDQELRRCTVYEARPEVCRSYPGGKRCGYYEFLKFERKHQDDPHFVPKA